MTTCQNCGVPGAESKYCSQCGQSLHIHLDPTFHDLIHDGVHEFLHLDGKIFKTIRLLLTTPGYLTKEFLAGRRASYINPIRLYLTMSILYFVLSALSYSDKKVKVMTTNDEAIVKEVVTDKAKTSKKKTDVDNIHFDVNTGTFLDPKLKEWAPFFKRGLERINQNSSDFTKVYWASVAKSLFLLMPVFAFILSLLYWRRKQRYPQYLYFSIHYHAALFAGLIITIPLSYISDMTMLWWMLWSWLYLFLSLKRIWGGSNKRAFLRTCLVLSVYGVIYAMTLGVIGIYSIYKLGAHS